MFKLYVESFLLRVEFLSACLQFMLASSMTCLSWAHQPTSATQCLLTLPLGLSVIKLGTCCYWWALFQLSPSPPRKALAQGGMKWKN